MKKNLLYALALATTMVACTNDDYTDWADPQQNEQEALKNVSFSVSTASSIDFATIESEYIPVFTAPKLTADNGAEVTAYTITLNNKHTLDATLEGKVLATELEAALIDLYGRRPTERTMDGLVKAYFQNNDGTALIATTNVSVKATPVAPVIENAYYLGGTPTNWSIQNAAFIFRHSGADVYDDPIFTITVEAPVDENGNRIDMWFKIAPLSAFESGSWDTVLGCAEDGCTDLTGALVGKNQETGADPGALKMPASDGAKFYKIELNMMDYVYTITPLNFEEFIYVPGNHQGWKPETAPALQSPNFDGVYTGYSYLNGNFKFTKARNWNAEYNFNDFTVMDDLFFNNDGSNINISEEGFYLITADIPSGKLSAIKTSWGIIGPAQAGGWDTDTDMEWNAEDESWTLTTELSADEFKFRANDAWDINFGGESYDELTPGGANLKVSEAGTYEIKLFLTRNSSNMFYCTLTKK